MRNTKCRAELIKTNTQPTAHVGVLPVGCLWLLSEDDFPRLTFHASHPTALIKCNGRAQKSWACSKRVFHSSTSQVADQHSYHSSTRRWRLHFSHDTFTDTFTSRRLKLKFRQALCAVWEGQTDGQTGYLPMIGFEIYPLSTAGALKALSWNL